MVRLKYFLIVAGLLSLTFNELQAQDTIQLTPKRELRGAWIATVTNIDWPSSGRTKPSKQRKELIEILDFHQKHGINAIFLQVRPTGDAFYDSDTEPWSKWLSGKQGRAPNPYYDPLLFAVEECHKRGMEIHAWFNPFRISNTRSATLAENNVAQKNPSWLTNYGGLQYLDPGIPGVRKYITKVIAEVASKYDVDGVHFDDYFYPYPNDSIALKDANTFVKYNPKGLKKDEWRRENLNIFIKNLSDTLSEIKPRLKFGISPFGIWRNRGFDELGSKTRGLSAYDHLYLDTRKWLQEGWLDYVAPQIYWSTKYKPARYDIVAQWWSDNNFGRHVYAGQAVYKIENNKDESWNEAGQFPSQIRINRSIPNVKGSIFYSTKYFRENRMGTSDSIRIRYFSKKSLFPTMPWKDSIPPGRPRSVKVNSSKSKNKITWKKSFTAPDGEDPVGYVVYRFADTAQVDIEDPNALLAILEKDQLFYVDKKIESGKEYQYYVTALDRLHNESLLPFIVKNVYPNSDLYKVAVTEKGNAQIFRKVENKIGEGRTRLILRGLSPNLIKSTLRVSIDDPNQILQVKWRKQSFDTIKFETDLKLLKDSIRLIGKQLSIINDSTEVLNLTQQMLMNKQLSMGSGNRPELSVEQLEKRVAYFEGKFLKLKSIIRGLQDKKQKALKGLDRLEQSIIKLKKRKKPQSKTAEILVQTNEAGPIRLDLSYMVTEAKWKIGYDLNYVDSVQQADLTYKTKIWQKTGEDWEEVQVSLHGKNGEVIDVEVPVNLASGEKSDYFVAKRSILPLNYTIELQPEKNKPAQLNGYLKNWRQANLHAGKVNVFNNGIFLRTVNLDLENKRDSIEFKLDDTKLIYAYLDDMNKKNWKSKLLGRESKTYRIDLCNGSTKTTNVKLVQGLPQIHEGKYKLTVHGDSKKMRSPNGKQLIWNLTLNPGQSQDLYYSYSIRSRWLTKSSKKKKKKKKKRKR